MTASPRRFAALVVAGALGLAPGVVALATVGAAPASAAAQQCEPGRRQLSTQTPPALATLGAQEAWTMATGEGVLVAVLDSGVDTRNEHLTSAVVSGIDLVGVDVETTGRTDPDGHGTAVAGQIAAREITGSGVVGLAPDAEILPVRVYYGATEEHRREGTGPDVPRLAAGIDAAVARGARVLNVSMSTPVDHPELRAAVERATAAGALVVASAGNRATSSDETDGLRYPAAYPGVLGVAAVDASGAPAADSIHGAHVDVAAPGTEVLTTYHADGDCLLGGENVSASFATAYVSAAAALVAQRYPDESPAQWAHRLMVTASRLVPGERDDLVGWGVVRADQALLFVDDGAAPGPDSPVHERPATPERPAQVLDTSVSADPLDAVRPAAAWWVWAGGTGLVLVALAAQLVGRRRRR
ncbi:S8 family serine peptidase [Cellulomonas fimi]|uniref:Peptidase S8 and S53 subtilisin kexin sedolisin n=1 Tax=Cellulomonas fimi (strain ATCC 484 / DSM 20113 / JCM 1341 / CCUG 24087 / LMG 16345 / NBRC 15513 / NCIMB 8980 / NCTC 7547 / NRS-133) TaxID=590998 RepID=F4H1C7_CELFA|nr:S8 family serine peptidase [Cellulomonas fimi]AEE45098.1 peptidase S8 and S53 subtilisin kexin sedolisin [Cellulomonas fimi ATCC 484]NNH06339.1 S8 family serine peptidase [Cellulomonas fimi]VEH28231.1 Intracellular serine protease [Cellulomonas fimi]